MILIEIISIFFIFISIVHLEYLNFIVSFNSFNPTSLLALLKMNCFDSKYFILLSIDLLVIYFIIQKYDRLHILLRQLLNLCSLKIIECVFDVFSFN